MKYNYDEFIEGLDNLIEQFEDFRPDIIVAVARGGVTIGHFLAQRLGIRKLFCINSIHYDDKNKLEEVYVSNIPDLGEENRILIVDDIIDSGESMREILRILQKKYPKNSYKIATIYYKKDALIQPDFTLHEAKEWVDFFWEVD